MTPHARLKYLLRNTLASEPSFPYWGTKVYFPKNSLLFHRVCKEGVFEKETVRILAALIQPESTYFDVGANIGLMSVPILTIHKTVKVVSFEPSPNNLPYLRRTSAESTLSDRWNIAGKAVGDKNGTVQFYTNPSALGAYDGIQNTGRAATDKGCTEAATQVTVPLTMLDTEWKGLGSPHVSGIKIDVEGTELQVLNGARELLQTCAPPVLLEWSAPNLQGAGTNPGELFTLARELDYSVYCAPAMQCVDSANTLKLLMLNHESFLMVPNSREVQLSYVTHKGLRD